VLFLEILEAVSNSYYDFIEINDLLDSENVLFIIVLILLFLL